MLPMPTPIRNRYGDLDDSDESDDDESDVVKALAAISPTIHFTSEHQSQKQRKQRCGSGREVRQDLIA